MKKIYGFAALCAAMTLASCSNNDEPVVNPAGGSKVETQTAYIAVSLATPALSTRATAPGANDYTDGDVNYHESDATSAVFAYFDGNGDFIGATEEIALDGWKQGTTETVEKFTSTLVSVEQPTGDNLPDQKKIKYIMAVINCPADVMTYFTQQSALETGRDNMVAMRKKVGAYTATTVTDASGTKGKFVMTNSAYGTGASPVYLTECSGNVYNSPAEAQNNPSAVIYVERVLARVDAIFNATTTLEGTVNGSGVAAEDKTGIGVIGIDGKYTVTYPEITVKVTGVEVANVASKSYLVKDLLNNDSYPVSGWYEANAKRSHWATIPSMDAPESLTFTNKSYTNIVKDSKPASGEFEAKGTKAPIYLQENTNLDHASAVLITAQLYNGNQPLGDLYRLTGNGNYYTEAAAKVGIQGYLQADGYRVSKEENVYESVPVEAIQIKDNGNKGWDGHVEIDLSKIEAAGEWKLYKVTGTTYVQQNVATVNTTFKNEAIASINKALAATVGTDGKLTATDTYRYGVRKWADGKCYYYQNIAVATDKSDDTKAVAGIVRNHIYKLNLNSIKGLGIPVFDPSTEIIPNNPPKIDPEDDWYLNAKINILQWGVYTQNVDFETPNE